MFSLPFLNEEVEAEIIVEQLAANWQSQVQIQIMLRLLTIMLLTFH